jgi:hypothetical protein
VQSLYDATREVQSTILKPDFRERPEAIRILASVREITKLAYDNLRDLEYLIDENRDRGSSTRSSKSDSEENAKNQAIFQNLNKHAGKFQDILDIIAGRENWSRLAPKPPRAPSASPHSATRLQPVDTSKMTISVPTSPYQPSIEEVDDTDAEDEVSPNVQHVHYVPKEDLPSSSAASSSSKTHPKRVVRPTTPPQVVIRQATDPKQFDSPPVRRTKTSASPLAASSGANDTESDDEPLEKAEPSLRPSALPKILTKQTSQAKNIKDLETEIARLQGQLETLDRSRDTETAVPDSARPDMGVRRTSGKHRSVDLTTANETLDTPSMRRPRASTSQGSERPKSFVEGSSYDPYRSEMPPPPRPDKPRRTSSQKAAARGPSRSPRTTPFSAVERTDNYWDYQYSAQVPQSATADFFGHDPRTSLPTVLESRDNRTGRLGYRPKRNSAAFEDPRDNFRDFFDSGAGDFPLFGPSGAGSAASSQRKPRSRGNSRTQESTSPNAKPYISPHQLHESLPLEPDVRDISVTLEEVFFGTSQKYIVRRDKYDAYTGATSQEEFVLDVPIHRGLKAKSKIKFPTLGHQTPDGPRELHFRLVEV